MSARARVDVWAWPVATTVAIVAAWCLPPIIGRYYTQMLALAGIYAIVAQGLNLLVGFTGQTSLGHAGFYAAGAYTGALLTTKLGVGFWAALPIAIVVAAAVGFLVAVPALKVEGPYLAMVTIAFGIIVESILVEWSSVTGGTQGVLNIPRPTIAGIRLPLERQLVVIVAVVAITALVMRNVVRSPWGRAFVAVRDNPLAARSVGLGVGTVKAVAFAISAGCAGAGGHLFAALQGFISPEAFDFDTSIFFLIAVLFGGQGTLLGPIVGAAVMTFLPEVLQRFTDYRLVIYGVLIVGSLYALPLGVVGTLSRRRPLVSLDTVRSAATPAPPRGHVAPSGAILSFDGVRLVFGGVRALEGVTFDVAPQSIHALIGPNGAGKTALLNVLCGYYPATAGVVRLSGMATTGLRPERIARLGVGRTFQTTQLFGDMTVLDNVLAGFAGAIDHRLLDSIASSRRLTREEHARRAAALGMLEFVGYPGSLAATARSLPFGHQRLVELARALVSDPLLLAMDEPAAGLNPHEVKALDELILRIRARGVTVLLVEHHMELVMGVSDRVTVMDHGETLAEGPPAAIRADAHVIRAYLGEGDDAG